MVIYHAYLLITLITFIYIISTCTFNVTKDGKDIDKNTSIYKIIIFINIMFMSFVWFITLPILLKNREG